MPRRDGEPTVCLGIYSISSNVPTGCPAPTFIVSVKSRRDDESSADRQSNQASAKSVYRRADYRWIGNRLIL